MKATGKRKRRSVWVVEVQAQMKDAPWLLSSQCTGAYRNRKAAKHAVSQFGFEGLKYRVVRYDASK